MNAYAALVLWVTGEEASERVPCRLTIMGNEAHIDRPVRLTSRGRGFAELAFFAEPEGPAWRLRVPVGPPLFPAGEIKPGDVVWLNPSPWPTPSPALVF